MMTHASRVLTLTIAITVAVAAMMATASAETFLISATRTGNLTSTNTHFFIPLNDVGATAVTFSTSTTGQLVKITYNAECGVLGPPQSWLSVTILVDGVQAKPQSGTSFALCTSFNTFDFQWVGATRQSLANVNTIGTHKVQVLVDLNGGATTWWLGDSSIVVEKR